MVAGCHLNRREAVEVTVREAPERIRDLLSLGASFDRRSGGDLDLTREGGHSKRRIVHAGDITGRELERTLLEAADRAGNIQFFSDVTAIDLILEGPRARSRALPGGLRAERGRGRGHLAGAGGGAGHRRRGEGLPLHLQPGRLDRRRRGDGLAGRRGRVEHGVLPVPPHLPVPPRGQELPHQRGPARRGRQAAAEERRGVHGSLPSARCARAARRGGAGHRRGAEADRRRVRHPGHDAPGSRLPGGALPQHPPDLPLLRDRPHRAPHSRWCLRPTSSAAA